MAQHYQKRLVIPLPPLVESVQGQVTKVTKDHEIVDYNGFALKRRKTQPVENRPRNEPAPGTSYKTPHGQVLQAGMNANTANGKSPQVDEYDIDEELYYRLTRELQQLPENAVPADRLAAVSTSVCEAEAANCANPAISAALKEVFMMFNESLKVTAESGAIEFAEQSEERIADADLHIDLEARKAGLRARIQKFKQEEEEWSVLMEKASQLDIDIAAEEEEEMEPEHHQSSELDALRKLNKDVHRKLAMQVDGVCLLVGDVEELVSKANKSAQAMQAEYHQEKFKTFQHVDSPAHLIKAILKGN